MSSTIEIAPSRERSPLALIHEGPVDLDMLEEFRAAMATDGLEVEIRSGMSVRASAWSWLAPTAVLLWISKSYFDGLLKELGKAHASILDKALRQLGRRLSGLKYWEVTAKKVVAIADRYSPILSVWTERHEGGRFKMLIASDLEGAALDSALSAYITFVQAYHTGALDPEDLAILAEARPVGDITLLAYDQHSGTIQLVDPLEARLA
ncbi:hypothetical protein [Caulobacter sp. RL271]|uniref:Uncharacterized protein n=1 Tax=Caulobacter segnis TaxID=88688 RepID=A0ABY4ZSH0_9CAUL|nr:hypothetical protein [Caulobacter segnis]USQ95455.1 hypothetical protein MZV50_23385 [Caulobacter segnis]